MDSSSADAGRDTEIKPTDVFTVLGESASAADLARWMRRMRAMDVVGWLNSPGVCWADAAIAAATFGGLVCVVWLVRRR